MNGSTFAQAHIHMEQSLGLVFDEDHKFHEQVTAGMGRANRVLGLVRRAFKVLENRYLPLLYRTLVRPHLEYANVAWEPTLRSGQGAIESREELLSWFVPCVTFSTRIDFKP